MPTASLVAVQVRLGLEDYISLDAFARAVRRVGATAADAIDRSTDGAVVVLPEHLGFLLSVVPYHRDDARRADSFESFLTAVAGSDTAEARREVFVEHATEVAATYDALCSSLARELGAHLVGGSITVPPMDESPHRGGWTVLDDGVLHNVSPLFSPSGRCIGRTAKTRIPPGEDRLTTPGTLESLHPSETPLGRIGVALCFDGYHHRPIERLDALGAVLVAQPVHFPDPLLRYDGTGVRIPAHEDFGRLLQGRENIRYGVCAALVGETFPDRRAEGISHIVANRAGSAPGAAVAVLATATEPFDSAAVSVAVDL